MNINDEEIDLIEMLKRIYSFIGNYKWIMIGVFVIGMGLGYYLTTQKVKMSKDIYRTQFIVESPFISNNEIYMIGRDLSFNIELSSKGSAEIAQSVEEIECSKDIVIEGKEPEVNMVFRTTKSIDVKQLTNYVASAIQANSNYQRKFNLEKQHFTELLNTLNTQIKALGENRGIPYITLLEKKQQVEKNMMVIEHPIQFYPIAPLNKLEPAAKFSILSVVGYGIILSLFSVLVILFFRLMKLVTTK